jgi:hypothetical protein
LTKFGGKVLLQMLINNKVLLITSEHWGSAPAVFIY